MAKKAKRKPPNKYWVQEATGTIVNGNPMEIGADKWTGYPTWEEAVIAAKLLVKGPAEPDWSRVGEYRALWLATDYASYVATYQKIHGQIVHDNHIIEVTGQLPTAKQKSTYRSIDDE